MSWSLLEKNGTFCTAYFIRRKFFKNLCFISMYRVLNKLSEYTIFTYIKTLLHTIFCLLLKSSKAFSVFLTLAKHLISSKKMVVSSTKFISLISWSPLCTLLVSFYYQLNGKGLSLQQQSIIEGGHTC